MATELDNKSNHTLYGYTVVLIQLHHNSNPDDNSFMTKSYIHVSSCRINFNCISSQCQLPILLYKLSVLGFVYAQCPWLCIGSVSLALYRLSVLGFV